MAVVTTKSLSITNLDASPIVANAVGEGAPGITRVVMDSITAVVGDSIGSIYRLCRIPTTAKIKSVYLYSPSITTGAGDIELMFSDSLTDGTQQALNALANPVVQISGPADNKMFGSAVTLAASAARQDVTFKNTSSFLPAYQNLPVWQVLVALGATQFTTDPGGFFDLGIKLTTAIATAGGVVSGEVYYVGAD